MRKNLCSLSFGGPLILLSLLSLHPEGILPLFPSGLLAPHPPILGSFFNS